MRVLLLLQEFKGYVFKIMGGQDKQGFPMKQGVLTNARVQVRGREGAALHAVCGGGVGASCSSWRRSTRCSGNSRSISCTCGQA